MIASQPMAPFQTASLYVGDLHPDATESTLFEKFNAVGPVASIRVCRDSVNRVSLGYAYVNFHNVSDADRALDTMNFTDILSKPCRIMWSQRDPSLRKTGQNNIFVRNLAPTVDNKGLYDTFSVFGNILSCKVVTDDKGVSKGYGYVHFETADAAQDAISKFDGMMIDDIEVKVSLFVRKQDRGAQNVWTNVYLKQFPATWDEQFIRDLVGAYGGLVSVHLSRDEEGKSKGFAFVNFETHEAAERAVAELNGRVFDEQPLYVGRAQKKAERARELKAKQDTYNLERMSKSVGKNLYVKNVDDAVTDEVFRAAFQVFGAISSAKIMRDRETGASKGFGFVCFDAQEDAAKAVAEMNNTPLGGKPLFVALYQKKEQRRAALAANYSPQNMHRFQGGAQGQQLPFNMNMYMQGGAGQFPGGRGGAQGGQGFPFVPRGPGGFGGRGGGFRGGNNQNNGGNAGPQQGFNPQGFAGYKGGAPRGAPQGFNPNYGPGPQGFNRRPMGGQPMGQPVQPGAPMGQNPRGRVMPPGPPGGFPQPMGPPGQPMGPPGQMMMMQYPGGMMMVPRGPPGPGPMGPQGQQMLMQPPGPQGVKFTAQARNQNAGGLMPPQGPVGAQQVFAAPQGHKQEFSDMLLKEQDPQRQKNLIGEQLYPLIDQHQPQLAGKITGMLLEMDNGELLNLLESPEALAAKIEEALTVLRNHSRAQGL